MLNFLLWFVVGPVVGWLAGRVMRTNHNGWLDALAGLVGAILVGTGCELFGLDFSSTPIGAAVTAAAAAVVVTILFRVTAGDKLASATKPGNRRSSYTSYKSRMGK